MTAATLFAAALGVGAGCGLLLVIVGFHGDCPQRHRWVAQLRSRAGIRDQRSMLRLAVAVAAGLAAGVATGWLVGAALVGMACWALPRVLGRDREGARRIERIEAIATWTEMLRDTLSAAAGLEQAILATAPVAPAAIKPEIGELAARLSAGERLAPSLRRLAEQLADPTGDLVVASLVMAAEHHARQLGELLGSLAHAAREQASMRLRVEASRARTRTSVRVIVGSTLAFAAAVVLFNRSYLSAYDTAGGQLVLLVVGALFVIGFGWLIRIAAVSEPTRLLAPTATDLHGRQPNQRRVTRTRSGVTR